RGASNGSALAVQITLDREVVFLDQVAAEDFRGGQLDGVVGVTLRRTGAAGEARVQERVAVAVVEALHAAVGEQDVAAAAVRNAEVTVIAQVGQVLVRLL